MSSNTVGHESTVDKIKDVLHLNKSHNTTTGTHSGTAEGVAGPHSTRAANAADPTVDSDLDGSRNAGVHTGRHTGGGLAGTTGTTGPAYNTGGGLTGTTGTTGTASYGSTNAGPHSSNLANKLDPRIDSDLDGRNAGVGGTTGTTGTTGYSGTHAGNSVGNRHTGDVGGLSNSTNAGPHNSNLANKVDPRVDSDLDGKGNRHGAANGGVFGVSGSHATRGSGTAQNTDGPHNSDTLNKLDPRVDSDRDGSNTYGGNVTNVGHNRDVHDAAQVPPSVFAAHHGEPQIMHDDVGYDRARRHGSVAHQDQHQLSGI
ncbi:hypothetical protein B7494_g2504 [Chlorociboria aeruginascens]|nr:hypothetical protein B7494_g2504 [Chlorociboria aeruginascens]